MKIDLHCHYYPQEYIDELKKWDAIRSLSALGIRMPPPDSVEERLDAMRDAQVDMAVVSVSTPNVFLADAGASMALAQLCNDAISDLCRSQPRRFRGLINVPLTNVNAALQELRRARELQGMVGVALGTNIAGMPLDSAEFWPFYEELDRLRLPVLVHPMEPVGIPHARDYRMTAMMGFLFETCMAATRLVFGGVVEKYPNFPIILCHLGGAIPFISDRIDRSARVYSDLQQGLSKAPIDYFRRMYYDTALSYGPVPLSCALQVLGESQIVLGTDYPFTRADHASVVPSIEALDLTSETKERIFWKNASSLLGLAERSSQEANS